MTDITKATLDELTAALAEADKDLATSTTVLRIIVPELLRRLEKAEKDLVDEDPPIELEVPTTPVDAVEDFGHASDRYEGEWPYPYLSFLIPPETTPKELLTMLRGKNGRILNGSGIVLGPGVHEGIWIGGGHKYAISNADGSPLGDFRIVFSDGSRVDGFKIGNNKGGMVGELRLVDPVLRADDRDVTIYEDSFSKRETNYIVVKQGDEDDVIIDAEEALHDGLEMGDFAPLRLLDPMPDLHLVCINTRIEVDKDWTGYNGFGIKWAVFLKTCKATFDGFIADAAREHSFYYQNTVDLFVEGAENLARLHTDKLGVARLLGNGRTFEQHANRVPQDYPKGGDPSTGRIVFLDCEAVRCGWEGMLPVVDKKTGLLKPGTLTGKGGSDFTNHGHTGELKALINCKSMEGLCGAIACWNEAVAKSASTANPKGVRCWLMIPSPDAADGLYTLNPLEASWNKAWGTRRLVIRDFQVIGDRHPKQRPPFLISGTRKLEFSATVNGETITSDSEHLKLDHQKKITSIESVEMGP